MLFFKEKSKYLRYRRKDTENLTQIARGKLMRDSGSSSKMSYLLPLRWRPAEISLKRREDWEQIGTKNSLFGVLKDSQGVNAQSPPLLCNIF